MGSFPYDACCSAFQQVPFGVSLQAQMALGVSAHDYFRAHLSLFHAPVLGSVSGGILQPGPTGALLRNPSLHFSPCPTLGPLTPRLASVGLAQHFSEESGSNYSLSSSVHKARDLGVSHADATAPGCVCGRALCGCVCSLRTQCLVQISEDRSSPHTWPYFLWPSDASWPLVSRRKGGGAWLSGAEHLHHLSFTANLLRTLWSPWDARCWGNLRPSSQAFFSLFSRRSQKSLFVCGFGFQASALTIQTVLQLLDQWPHRTRLQASVSLAALLTQNEEHGSREPGISH